MTIHDYKYISGLSSRSISQSTYSTKRDIGIFANYRAKFAPYSRDVVASRKTSRDNEHNSMSPACASLINYSSCVIEAFANFAAPSFVASMTKGLIMRDRCLVFASLFTRAPAYIHIYIYVYTRAREFRDCIIAKSLIERQVSNAAESWEETAVNVH